MFKKITDQNEIRKILDSYMLDLESQKVKFIPTIVQCRGSEFNGVIMKGEHIIEGSRPISCMTNNIDRYYSLANSDTNYSRSFGLVGLSTIEYIEVM